ncbi:hypothetical protein D3C86_1567220 [compost metagenome]
MPNERTRVFIQTRDFLVELTQDPALSASIRRQAHQLLRHYPHANEILRAGQLEERSVDRLTEPFLSSNIDYPRWPRIVGPKPLIRAIAT